MPSNAMEVRQDRLARIDKWRKYRDGTTFLKPPSPAKVPRLRRLDRSPDSERVALHTVAGQCRHPTDFPDRISRYTTPPSATVNIADTKAICDAIWGSSEQLIYLPMLSIQTRNVSRSRIMESTTAFQRLFERGVGP